MQVNRAVRRLFLRALPGGWRRRFLERFPNWRKAAPPGSRFVFDKYLGNLRVNIDTRYLMERVMWTGVIEPALWTLVKRHVPAGSVCIDVGANVGAVTLMLAQQVGGNGRVIAIEPAPPNLMRYQANLDLNPQLKACVTLVTEAVGAEAAALFWCEEPGNPGNGWLRPQGEIPVRVVKLDDVVDRLALPRVDFIKIDVEGMELPVLQGARRTLERFKPMLYYETTHRFRDAAGKGTFELIAGLLRGIGYKLYDIGPGGELVEVQGAKAAKNTVAACL